MDESNDNKPDKRKDEMEKLRKELLGSGEKKKPQRPRRLKSPSTDGGHSVNGDNNITGDGNTVTNHYHAPPVEKKNIIVKTGDGTITAAQQAALKALVDEIVGLEAQLKKYPRSYGAVWGALNTKMDVTRYVEIHQDAFPAAKKFLMRQRAILLSMASAPKKVTKWRTSRYATIKVRAKQFPDGETRYRRYAQEHFGLSSLSDLDDEQLEVVYKHVIGWK